MKFTSRCRSIALAVATVFALNASNSQAHSDDFFDANPSPHGGQVRMSGAYHFELLMDEKEVVVYVTDHANQPIATTGAVATLEIKTAKKNIAVDLAPAEGNTLKPASAWSGTLSPDLTAQLSVTFPNKKPSKAKFAPFAKRRK